MRRENYIIALLNQDAIPHCVEVPLLGSFSIFTRGFNHVFLSVITNVLFQTNDLRPEVLSAKTEYVRERERHCSAFVFDSVRSCNLTLLVPFDVGAAS